MFGTYVAGIGVSGQKGYIAVLELRKRSVTLRHLSEFGKESADQLWYLAPLLRREIRILKKVRSVSVALDHESVFMHSFPTDSTLTRDEMNDHLAWELTQFVPEYDANTHTNDLHILKTHAQEKVHDVFVVTAERSLVRALEESLVRHKYALNIADTNHFGAGYALAACYPEVKSKKVAIVGVMPGRADLGILTNSRLSVYRYQHIRAESEALDFIAPHIQTESVSDIFFYGLHAGSPLANNARGRFGADAALLDPFRHIDTKPCADELARYTGHEHLFAPAIGCALRRR